MTSSLSGGRHPAAASAAAHTSLHVLLAVVIVLAGMVSAGASSALAARPLTQAQILILPRIGQFGFSGAGGARVRISVPVSFPSNYGRPEYARARLYVWLSPTRSAQAALQWSPKLAIRTHRATIRFTVGGRGAALLRRAGALTSRDGGRARASRLVTIDVYHYRATGATAKINRIIAASASGTGRPPQPVGRSPHGRPGDDVGNYTWVTVQNQTPDPIQTSASVISCVWADGTHASNLYALNDLTIPAGGASPQTLVSSDYDYWDDVGKPLLDRKDPAWILANIHDEHLRQLLWEIQSYTTDTNVLSGDYDTPVWGGGAGWTDQLHGSLQFHQGNFGYGPNCDNSNVARFALTAQDTTNGMEGGNVYDMSSPSLHYVWPASLGGSAGNWMGLNRWSTAIGNLYFGLNGEGNGPNGIYQDTISVNPCSAQPNAPAVCDPPKTEVDRADCSQAAHGTNWMQCMFPPGEDGTKLSSMAIPGSHDSGTSGLDAGFVDEASSSCTGYKSIDYLEEDALYNYAVAQDLDVKNQLDAGIRYLDIRAAWTGGSWRPTHTTYSNETLASLLETVDTWARQHPTEAVIVDLNHICEDNGAGSSAEASLLSALQTVCDVAYDGGNPYTATLAQLRDSGRNVVLTLDSSDSMGKDIAGYSGSKACPTQGDNPFQLNSSFGYGWDQAGVTAPGGLTGLFSRANQSLGTFPAANPESGQTFGQTAGTGFYQAQFLYGLAADGTAQSLAILHRWDTLLEWDQGLYDPAFFDNGPAAVDCSGASTTNLSDLCARADFLESPGGNNATPLTPPFIVVSDRVEGNAQITNGGFGDYIPAVIQENTQVPWCQDGSSSVSNPGSVTITLPCSGHLDPTNAYQIIAGPHHGTLSGNDGVVTYTPDPSDPATSDSFSFAATGPGGTAASPNTSNTATMNIAITELPPTDVTPPTISGSAVQGELQTESHGTWNGSPSSYGYQWQDCDPNGSGCSDIAGATSQTYTLTSSDVGHTVEVIETATNTAGSARARSMQTDVVVPPTPSAPVNVTPPTISGSAVQGQQLTELHGTWTNNPTGFTYLWQDCDSGGSHCQVIAGATGQTYTLTSADVGHTVEVSESATNAGGSGSASSSPTMLVLPLAPTNVTPPTISGTAVQGQLLAESHGTWTNSPTGFGYQWKDCDSSGNDCISIAGAKSQTYTLSSSDLGHTVRVIETATNAGGSGSASSSQTQVVVPPAPSAPVNITPPAISGTAVQGQLLAESHGTWTNNPTGYAYQWEDCSLTGNACEAIAGATSQTYTLASSDVGHTVLVIETASNAGGSAAASSPPTGEVVALFPHQASIRTSGSVSRRGSTVNPGLSVSCPAGGPSCSAAASATVVLRAGPLPGAHAAARTSIGSTRFAIPAGGSVQATFALDRLGRILLSDHKRLQVQLQGFAEPRGGTPITASKALVLYGSFARYEVSALKVNADGTATLRVKTTAPGQVNILITAWNDNIAGTARVLKPGPGRFVVARAGATARQAGVLTFTVRPNARGRRLIAHPAYRVTLRLWVSYTPLYAFETDTGYYGLHPGGRCQPCHMRTWP